jgi:integrase
MAGQIVARGKGTWLVRIFSGRDGTGKRIYRGKTIHGTKKDAEAYLHEELRRRDLAGTEVGALRTPVGELLDDVLSDYKVNQKDYVWAETKVRLHLRPAFGAMSVMKLTTSAIQQYVAKRLATKAANATINRELAILKRALNLGRKHTPPKVHRVPHIPMLEENNVRKGFFEHDEFKRLREVLPPEIQSVLTFAYYTGCRRGEILGLAWDQVDLSEGVIRLDPGTTKNDEPRVIPLTSALRELLQSQKLVRDQEYPASPYVFSRQGERILDFRGAWEVGCKQVGLWVGDPKSGKPSRLFHDLRRTGVRNLIRAGVPERIAMAVSGHKTRSVFDRYNIVSEADLKEAANRLDSYLSGKETQRKPAARSKGTKPGTLEAHNTKQSKT